MTDLPTDDAVARHLDGEASITETLAVLKAERENAVFAEAVRAAREERALIAAAFDEDLAPPPAAMVAAIRAEAAASAAPAQTRRVWVPTFAAAAGLALAVGLGALYSDWRLNSAMDQLAADRAAEAAALTSLVQTALETGKSGQTVAAPAPRGEVKVTPIKTWKSRTGHWCREFEERASGAEAPRTAVACRAEGGVWVRRKTVIEGESPAL